MNVLPHIKTTEYYNKLVEAMTWLNERSNSLFIGQSILWDGHFGFKTMVNVSQEKRIETPVSEDFQMGQSIGLALEGFVPLTFYPRFDFLLLATNQLFNHLDNFKHWTNNEWVPKVIIRVAVGGTYPMNPGVQHQQDYTEAFKLMAKEINIVTLTSADMIVDEYKKAYNSDTSAILVEYSDMYRHKEV